MNHFSKLPSAGRSPISLVDVRLAAIVVVVAAGFTGLFSCSSRPPEEPAIGVAYVGPAKLILRTDLTVRSPARITVSHGDRLDILETRRKFARVRNAEGSQGWTDTSNLLTAQQMEELANVGEAAGKLPSQGKATVFDQLNAHTEPNRQSPSFFQIPEGGSVDVIGHRVSPRNQPAPRIPLPPAESARTAKKRMAKAPDKKAMLIPAPSPLPPPEDWQARSRPRAADLPGFKAPTPAAAPSMDDWSLVRADDGKVGWVLSRMIFMSIPDEVAQYAEGHRITAYMALDDFADDGAAKPSWLWTTASPGQHSAEFDSFRVFAWNTKHHRYETAHIERNLTGHYPVELVIVPGEKGRGFSLIVTDKNGQTSKRTYSFAGRRVKLISKQLFERPSDATRSGERPSPGSPFQTPDPAASWWQRFFFWAQSLR